MTAQEHNRLLGIAYTVYGGVSFVLLSLVAFYLALVLGLISHDRGLQRSPGSSSP
jgi:hypothetical protein